MKNMLYRALFFLALIILAATACQSPKNTPTATLLLLNGQFFTADSAQASATAMAILNDRILYVGDEAGARALADKNTQIMDLKGQFAMPGFIEGHGHFASLGNSLLTVNLMDTKSWEEVIEKVAEKAKTVQPGEIIEGRGWHQEKWTHLPPQNVGGYPLHQSLSALTPNNPVILSHASGHGLFANAKAMQLAGISRETPDPVGGRIVRDAGGNPIGIFEENAADLLNKVYAEAEAKRTEADRQAYFDKTIQLATQACLVKGITSFQDAGSNFWEIEQYSRLAKADQLALRLWVMISSPKQHDFHKLDAFPQVNIGGQNCLTVRAMKAYLDGALGSYGAWLLEPYSDKPGFYGQNTTPVDTIAMLAKECRKHNLQLCVHAIGDRGNREMLNVFEKTFQAMPGKDLRWRMEHTQHTHPADIPRFGQLGVIASMQAIHCTSDAPFVVKRLGEARAKTGAYAWRSLLDAGAHIANGTDTPVEAVDPLPCLYATVTRKRADNGFSFYPEQSMTRHEALLSYTRWNAYAAFEEQEKGVLVPGKLADVVILDKNLLTCAPEDLLKAKVLKTIVGGKVAYER